MYFFSSIKNCLIEPNVLMSNLINTPLIFLGMYINLLIFKNLLNLDVSKKQTYQYVILTTLWTTFCNVFIQAPLGLYINCFILPGIVMSIFRTRLIKSIFIALIPTAVTLLFETILCKIYSSFLYASYSILTTIPLYKMALYLQIYFIMYLIYLIIKRNNFSIKISDNFSKESNIQLLLNIILATTIISVQFYLLIYYTGTLPIIMIILSSFLLTLFFFMIINNIIKISKLEVTSIELKQSQEYNKTLEFLYDSIKAFKHDFNNIIQTIGGYANSNDIEGLKIYYKDLFVDCQKINDLTALNPNVVNNPGVYCLLTAKYKKAEEQGIKIHIDFFLNLNGLNMKMYEFTRILGILLDNAIEASTVCDNKVINIIFNTKTSNNMQYVLIENTYSEKDIDTEKIFEKGYSSKPKNTGLGLWEVRQILKKNTNLNLFTSKDDAFFRQQLEIFES